LIIITLFYGTYKNNNNKKEKIMFCRLFKPATERAITIFKNVNKRRRGVTSDCLFGGVIAGTFIGGGLGVGYGFSNSVKNYQLSIQNNESFNTLNTALDLTKSTVVGGVSGALSGVGLGLMVMVPEVILTGAALTLAYKAYHKNENTDEIEEVQRNSLRP
jgi:hypothetical protein